MRKERSKVEGTGRRQEAAGRWNSLEKPSSHLATQALCHPQAPEQAELCQRLPGISQSRREPNRGASGSWNPPAFHTPTRSCEQTVPTQGGAGRVSCFTQMQVSFPGSRAWRRCICLIVTKAPYAPQPASCILQSRLQFHKLKSPTLALPFQKPVIPDLDSHVDHTVSGLTAWKPAQTCVGFFHWLFLRPFVRSLSFSSSCSCLWNEGGGPDDLGVPYWL